MTAGTRSAPTVDGTGTYRLVSIRLIDETGDIKSFSVRCPVTVTNAEIEAFVADYQDVTQASVFAVHVTEVYSAVEDKNDATVGNRDSVYDTLNVLTRNAAGTADSLEIFAPDQSTMLDYADEMNPASATLAAFFTTGLALLNGGAGGSGDFGVISTRYTERKERNKAVKV